MDNCKCNFLGLEFICNTCGTIICKIKFIY